MTDRKATKEKKEFLQSYIIKRMFKNEYLAGDIFLEIKEIRKFI